MVLLAGIAIGLVATAGTAFARSGQHISIGGDRDPEQAGPDSARVATLLGSLGQSDPLVCDMLADQIGNFWTDAGRYGIGRLSDAPAQVLAAKDSLHGRVTSPGAIALLTSTLRSTNPCTRRVAAKLLGRSAATTAQLSALLADQSVTVREAAAYAVGGEERAEARGPLERLAKTNKGPDAAMAVWALGEFGDALSLPVIVNALAEGDAHVKLAAAAAMGEIHDLEHAPPALVEAARGNDAALKRIAARSLASIGDPNTLETLIALVSIDDPFVRMRVIEALGHIGSAKAAPVLMKASRDPNADVRRAAVEALGEVAKEG
jgi:HEAT repeat protein